MKDNIENKIRESHSRFDVNEPAEGHEARFVNKLNAGSNIKTPVIKRAWRIAATVAILIGMGFYFNRVNNVTDTPEFQAVSTAGLSLKDISPELAEVEFFYTAHIQQMAEKFAPIDTDLVVHHKNLLKQLELLEEDYNDLKLELEINYADERVVSSMIQNYRFRLQIIEQFYTQINTNNLSKIETDEKIEI